MSELYAQPVKFERTGPNATTDVGVEIRIPFVHARRETDQLRVVTEILAVRYDMKGLALATAASRAIALSFTALSAAEVDPSTGLSIGNTNIIDQISFQNAFTTTGGVAASMPITHFLTGGSGFGKLIPGDRMFYNAESSVADNTKNWGLEIYYRQALVGLVEFMGILASFIQNPT